MIEEKIVVSDSNIFFDLISVDLLDAFFKLPCEITTTDFVISEIKKTEQIKQIKNYIYATKLDVISFEFEEVLKIHAMQTSAQNNVSVTDCSVWYYAKQTDGRLLTGDAKLRKSAEDDDVKVSGILYIFDNVVEYGILEKDVCAAKLEKLLVLNPRLPKKDCEDRIRLWRNK